MLSARSLACRRAAYVSYTKGRLLYRRSFSPCHTRGLPSGASGWGVGVTCSRRSTPRLRARFTGLLGVWPADAPDPPTSRICRTTFLYSFHRYCNAVNHKRAPPPSVSINSRRKAGCDLRCCQFIESPRTQYSRAHLSLSVEETSQCPQRSLAVSYVYIVLRSL